MCMSMVFTIIYTYFYNTKDRKQTGSMIQGIFSREKERSQNGWLIPPVALFLSGDFPFQNIHRNMPQVLILYLYLKYIKNNTAEDFVD